MLGEVSRLILFKEGGERRKAYLIIKDQFYEEGGRIKERVLVSSRLSCWVDY